MKCGISSLVIVVMGLCGCAAENDVTSDSGIDSGSQADSSTETESATASDTGADTDADTDTNTNTDADTVTDMGTDSEVDTVTSVDTLPAVENDAGADAASDTGDLEIVGVYVSNFGENIDISNAQWIVASDWGTWVYTILGYDNDQDYLVAQYPPDDAAFPGKWTRFEWTYADELYYCQSIFGAETREEVSGAQDVADATDLDVGCSGFSWTRLTPADEVDAGPDVDDAGILDGSAYWDRL